MTDLPSGRWSPILVGPYWPGIDSVTSTLTAAENRGTVQEFFEDFSGQLRITRNGILSPMEGFTADSIRSLFESGESHATAVADKNGAKQRAFQATADALNGLRSALNQIAAVGNHDLDTLMQSNLSPSDKAIAMVAKICEKQREAVDKSIQFGSKITACATDILKTEGDPRTLADFAKDHGFSLTGQPEVMPTDKIRQFVDDKLKESATPGSTGKAASGGEGQLPPESQPNTPAIGSPNRVMTHSLGESGAGVGQPGLDSASPRLNEVAANVGPGSNYVPGITTQDTPVPSNAMSTPGATGVSGTPPVATTGGIATTHGAPAPSTPSGVSLPGGGGLPGAGLPSGVPSPLAPDALAQGFNNGFQAGAPMSTGTEALSHAVTNSAPITTQAQFSTPTGNLSAATAPSSGGYFTDGAFAGGSSPVAPMAVTPSPTMMAAPLAAAAGQATPPMSPAGPLPTYGADLRAGTPTITPSAPPAPMAPPPSAPTSAPVNPSGGAGVAQPAVVNKVPTHAASASAATPAGLTESAVAASGSGAAAGAAAAHNAAQARLRHLLDSVARQQPHLRWAIGERDDGTTVLVTDLASGWIPPNIDIPSGVHLLDPAFRRGGLEALLGDAVIIEAWTPGQFIPAEKDDQPVATSLRARDLPTVSDLNWELTQATNWRDGLPRLAHTLTKAGIAGTGILEAETDLLAEHLRAISEKVLRSYPDSMDAEAVGNWQLLAAIDALVNGRKTALNYHFAWFQALQHGKAGR